MSQLVRFGPNTEMSRLYRDVDSVFRDFFGQSNDNGDPWVPQVEIRETDDAYVVHMDVPGMQKENFQIDYHNGALTVGGERRAEERNEEEQVVRVERRYGSFYRSFALPKAVAAEKISASYQDGVLRIEVPKTEESKPRRISVE
jgi:HSP20 family protein